MLSVHFQMSGAGPEPYLCALRSFLLAPIPEAGISWELCLAEAMHRPSCLSPSQSLVGQSSHKNHTQASMSTEPCLERSRRVSPRSQGDQKLHSGHRCHRVFLTHPAECHLLNTSTAGKGTSDDATPSGT